MAQRLSASFVALTKDALHKSFWHKDKFKAYLSSSGVSGSLLGHLSEANRKIDWLNWLFPKLEDNEAGQMILERMARDLAEQRSFPDLMNQEDTEQKLAAAKSAVAALKDLVERLDQNKEETKRAVAIRERSEAQRLANIEARSNLEAFKARLDKLAMESLGTTQGGFDFEKWFYEFMDFCEIENRKPYKLPQGRQVDGAITLDGTTFHIELKFEAKPAEPNSIDSITKKVGKVHDNTMAIMVAMGGISEGAKAEASEPKSPVLLLDYSPVYLALSGTITFADVVRRVKRHASHEGEAFLPVSEFSG